ncbi:MAG TPA: hypothetical protein VMY35_16775 [Phycisphaerae bacterium]|nr:hypothetical protein [Phycisphaerae bacterium]
MELLNPLADSAFAAKTASFTGTAGSTGAWPAGPEGVVVWCSSAAYVLVGEDVTATATNGTPIPANTPIPFKVPGGTGAPWRVSAIQIASSGTVYAKPINTQ